MSFCDADLNVVLRGGVSQSVAADCGSANTCLTPEAPFPAALVFTVCFPSCSTAERRVCADALRACHGTGPRLLV